VFAAFITTTMMMEAVPTSETSIYFYIKCNDCEIKEVERFKYLGSKIVINGNV
jgi:hypothetical protein